MSYCRPLHFIAGARHRGVVATCSATVDYYLQPYADFTNVGTTISIGIRSDHCPCEMFTWSERGTVESPAFCGAVASGKTSTYPSPPGLQLRPRTRQRSSRRSWTEGEFRSKRTPHPRISLGCSCLPDSVLRARLPDGGLFGYMKTDPESAAATPFSTAAQAQGRSLLRYPSCHASADAGRGRTVSDCAMYDYGDSSPGMSS